MRCARYDVERGLILEFFKEKNVLITGINGFVGSNLANALRMFGANVFGIVREANGRNSHLRGDCTLFIGDVTDYKFMCDVISSNEIDIIYHFAANSIVRISARDPMTTYHTNVMGTVAILEAARNVGRCQSIVVASSDKAYGDHEQLPYKESHALQPFNTYDTSKAAMDMIARSYAKNYSMPITVTRCSNIYGPGDNNFSRLVPNTIRRINDGKYPLLYSDIENMTREFIYIDDVVDAYLLIAQNHYLTKTLNGLAVNIGGTGGFVIIDVIHMICDIMKFDKTKIEIVEREASFKEIEKQYIDASLLQEHTGWKCWTTLSEGLKRTVQWYTRIGS